MGNPHPCTPRTIIGPIRPLSQHEVVVQGGWKCPTCGARLSRKKINGKAWLEREVKRLNATGEPGEHVEVTTQIEHDMVVYYAVQNEVREQRVRTTYVDDE